MAAPSTRDEMALKRILRYLRGKPRACYLYTWQSCCSQLTVQVDSDWAGCSRTRKSTSGGVLSRGGHVLGTWSRTQATIALSSGEAELNGSLKGASELLGASAILLETGHTMELVIEGDSSACQGTLHREGVGRMKHLEVRQLWLQSLVKEERVRFQKIPRAQNAADTLTKHWGPDAQTHFDRVNFSTFAS